MYALKRPRPSDRKAYFYCTRLIYGLTNPACANVKVAKSSAHNYANSSTCARESSRTRFPVSRIRECATVIVSRLRIFSSSAITLDCGLIYQRQPRYPLLLTLGFKSSANITWPALCSSAVA